MFLVLTSVGAIKHFTPQYMKKFCTVTSATGAIAINTTTAIGTAFRLSSVTVKFSSAPTTSENLVVSVDAADGSAYDATLYSVNPSSPSLAYATYIPANDLVFEAGDEIKVAYTNTDTRTYGLRIVTQSL